MSEAKRNGLGKLNAKKVFTGTGVVGQPPTSPYDVRAEQQLVVAVEQVGGGNVILVKGRIGLRDSYSTLATLTGATEQTIDISLIDEVYFECQTYAAAGTPTLVTSAFFKSASGGGGGGGAPSGPAGGDLTGSYPNPVLGPSGVSAGVYGSTTQIPVLTLDSKGRVTSVTTATPPTGPAGPTGATGPAGSNGTNGTDGKTILNGSGAPSNALGVNGDFYMDTLNNRLYGPKTAGVWGPYISVVGPAGMTGNLDGGDAASVYGGISPVDGGGA